MVKVLNRRDNTGFKLLDLLINMFSYMVFVCKRVQSLGIIYCFLFYARILIANQFYSSVKCQEGLIKCFSIAVIIFC